MKKLLLMICIFSLITSLSVCAAASQDSACWYIKRNGNKRPILDERQKIIYDYDGYYIDESLGDEDAERKIYLTFDLGYENGNTVRILDALKKYDVKAAFFVLDNIILKNTDLVTRMLDEGHLICNHTKNHKDLSRATKDVIESDLKALEELMKEKTGAQLSKYFRFPEGKYSENALKCVKEMGYKSIFWSFAYDDWDNSRQMNPNKALNKILSNTHNGAIMLFHPTSKTNADIFPRLIESWIEMGYKFATLDELTA